MVGKRSGVAARLKQVNPLLLNVHCVCHRLALACTDTNHTLKYISNVELLLRQLWQYFQNSPKRMAAYLKIQTQLKSVRLEGKAVKGVTKRLKKACHTRWLSFEASVKAVHEDYEAVLQTLAHFQESDAIASGLLTKMKKLKFIGVIYILRDILPILGDLSRRFQKGYLSFAAIVPAINMTKDRLHNLVADAKPMESLSRDIESFTDMCAEIKMNQNDAKELHTLFEKYVSALVENIDNRFTDSSPVLEAFNVFDPMLVPDSGVEMRSYGHGQIEVLSNHYFKENPDKSDRLKAEWEGMKYHLRDVIKPSMPDSVKSGKEQTETTTEWCLLQLLKNIAVRQLYPNVIYIAEVIASLPVSNAWPERGASTLKALKTRLRNRLSTSMLESLLHICINAPKPSSLEGQQLVKAAVNAWLENRNRRKLPKQSGSATVTAASATSVIDVEDAGVQTDPYMDVSEDVIRTAVDIALKKLSLDEYDAGDSDSDWSDDEDCCSKNL
ncbi:zinc finger protein 862-like [Mya arenaria]|nr:zinc finger protein 862-like [Mya arenaria]XP_052786721.1 zinc finger protein 862-like [Mya arenaria]XP_052786722.1 zinc finger protein 862-like [Mya arenaria]XP_052789746.1 zinc finger protein 862-like [Mya arenaria]XP_052792737.1 zinc finger protein 862-like [Mya arenaria]XP_052803784.1 zinc finger protein 862-like [Mya arenaria]XP_052810137.1 zinc finger protein 862-like [Mya arenaria]XP_052819427.1 zinc finger protein 862-like [Mya arenaria]XP_052819502.1 zinc finger protein 862-like